MAIVGNDEALAASLISTILRGWLHSHSTHPCPQVYYLDGARSEDSHASQIRPWLESPNFSASGPMDLKPPVTSDVRGVDRLIETLYREWENRMARIEENHPSIVLFVANLARFRELKRVEDFSFGSSNDPDKPTSEAAFAKILRDGPSVGIHVVLWSDSWGTLSRFIPRQGLRDIEIRALMQMSGNDSNQLIDSSAANKLEPHAIIYFDEADGKITKVRPYRM